MAIVPNLDGQGIKANGFVDNAADAGLPTNVDRSYVHFNRTSAGTPLGTLTPLYSGEVVLDTTNGDYYYAAGQSSAGWVPCVIGG